MSQLLAVLFIMHRLRAYFTNLSQPIRADDDKDELCGTAL